MTRKIIESGVYQIQNKINGKSYVGSAQNLASRYSKHLLNLREKTHHSRKLQNAWEKYGAESFVFNILEKCSMQQLLLREQYYIDKLNTYKNGYNILPNAGSWLDAKHSEISKNKIKESLKKFYDKPENKKILSDKAKKQIKEKNFGPSTWSLETKEANTRAGKENFDKLWKIPGFKEFRILTLLNINEKKSITKIKRIDSSSYFIFSGGEVHCSGVIPNSKNVTLVCQDYSMNGLMAICQYREIYQRNGAKVQLMYPYLPYARQDRIMVEDESFSLRLFCNILNYQKFDKIICWDIHSDVGSGLLENCVSIPQFLFARKIIPKKYFKNKSVMFVSPDAGAYKKLSKLVADDTRIVIGLKNRDSKGKIIHTSVYSPQDLQDRTCIIVDDICDGGRTFIELAKALRKKGTSKVVLYITHGIFSQGFAELSKHIDEIYTTNSFPEKPSNNLVTYSKII